MQGVGEKKGREEEVILQFLAICQPSLDPTRYSAVVDACEWVARNRHLTEGCVAKCLQRLLTTSSSTDP
jgi:hypothetical protein